MAASLVVPDASVLLKWLLPSADEPDSDKALLLRDAILNETVQALVPTLWVYEVGNTTARRFPAHAEAWLSALMKFGLEELPPSQPWLTQTLELIRRHEVSFYDAAYHAVALVHGGVFVTADTRYAARVRASGSVISLHDWQPPGPRSSRHRDA
jgi:predicted nucleic acid-binding protein